MLRSYLPALVFVGLGLTLGLLFTFVNAWLGARQPRRDVEPYECGLPSEVRGELPLRDQLLPHRHPLHHLDLEVILLVPVVLQVEAYGVHALGAVGVFILFLGVAFVYEWRRGSLDWEK